MYIDLLYKYTCIYSLYLCLIYFARLNLLKETLVQSFSHLFVYCLSHSRHLIIITKLEFGMRLVCINLWQRCTIMEMQSERILKINNFTVETNKSDSTS